MDPRDAFDYPQDYRRIQRGEFVLGAVAARYLYPLEDVAREFGVDLNEEESDD